MSYAAYIIVYIILYLHMYIIFISFIKIDTPWKLGGCIFGLLIYLNCLKESLKDNKGISCIC